MYLLIPTRSYNEVRGFRRAAGAAWMAKRFTYQELSDQWGISLAAVKQRVRRGGWKRTRGNDRVVRIEVPSDVIEDSPVPPKKPQKTDDMGIREATLWPLVELTENHTKMIQELTGQLLTEKETNAALRERIATLEANLAHANRAPMPRVEDSLLGRFVRIISRK